MIATGCPNRSDHRDPAEASLSFMIVNLIIIETVLVVVAQLMLRHGATKLDMPSLSIGIVVEAVQNVWIMSGLALHGISFFLYVFILSRLRLNIIYPVATSASLVLITLLSVIILKEKLTAVQVAGISIIMVGMVVVFVER
jgi:drug/metabolite transporter (DMT)-like permease